MIVNSAEGDIRKVEVPKRDNLVWLREEQRVIQLRVDIRSISGRAPEWTGTREHSKRTGTIHELTADRSAADEWTSLETKHRGSDREILGGRRVVANHHVRIEESEATLRVDPLIVVCPSDGRAVGGPASIVDPTVRIDFGWHIRARCCARGRGHAVIGTSRRERSERGGRATANDRSRNEKRFWCSVP